MRRADALRLLDRSYALHPCKGDSKIMLPCRKWDYKAEMRCPSCKTSPSQRIKDQRKLDKQ